MEQSCRRKSLDKLGFPGYEIDTFGNIFCFAFNKAGLTPKEVSEIRLKYASGQYLQKELAIEYGVTNTTIRRVIRLSNENNWKKLKPRKRTNGYLQVVLYLQSKKHTKLIHRIVLEVFIGPCPEGWEAAHNDGNPKNNILENLRWATKSDNAKDKVVHGTDSRGERCPTAKLTANIVLEMRKDYDDGITRTLISKKYKVKYGTVCDIIKRSRWKYL